MVPVDDPAEAERALFDQAKLLGDAGARQARQLGGRLDNSADPLSLKAYQYDLVCNGFEIASGSIRNQSPELVPFIEGEVDDPAEAERALFDQAKLLGDAGARQAPPIRCR
jgi:hypothetical protein